MIINFIEIVICLFIIFVYELRIRKIEEYYLKKNKTLEDEWKNKLDRTKNFYINEDNEKIKELTSEKSKLFLKATELDKKLTEEFNANNELREEIIRLNNEITELNSKREKVMAMKKIMPKRPKKGNKDQIEQYVKDYLRINGIDFKVKNKTNSLFSVANDTYEIYCGTERFINKKTKEIKNGLKNMVHEIKRSSAILMKEKEKKIHE